MAQTRAIRLHQTGSAAQLLWETVPLAAPGRGEILVRHTAVGLNFIDIYFRTGLYPLPEIPAVLGMEAAGVVEAVGQDVTDLQVGERVAYVTRTPGAYAEKRVLPADAVVRVPDTISDAVAAATLLKGLTAYYLLHKTFLVKSGQTILFHAAAGGVGLLACQWAKLLGATIIGTVGSEAKASLARANGCDHVILYRQEDFVARVREITRGQGVDVVYDAVGADTFLKSLDCLRRFGCLVSFGQASGPIAPLDVGLLSAKGSLYLTRPTLFTHIGVREDYLAYTQALFAALANGTIGPGEIRTYPLCETAAAHADLEGRKTTGSVILLPD